MQLMRKDIQTPLGAMIAITDDTRLYCLVFADQPQIELRIASLAQRLNAEIVTQNGAPVLIQLEDELMSYFAGTLVAFTVPCVFTGTFFQRAAWHALQQLRYGTTIYYQQQAAAIQKPGAFRAVANANGANMLAIIVPCHRVVKKSGALCGYNGGIWRKAWLLQHEQVG